MRYPNSFVVALLRTEAEILETQKQVDALEAAVREATQSSAALQEQLSEQRMHAASSAKAYAELVKD